MTTPTTTPEPLVFTLGEVLAATGATLVSGGSVPPGRAVLRGLTTDSRAILAGGLFIGLPGERFDGSDFAAQALAQGAGAVLVSDSKAVEVVRAAGGKGVVLAHASPLRALGLFARWHRRRLPAKVVAITGTNGKTTTKEMLRHALGAVGPTLATEGNLNNEIGAPLTLLGLRPSHRFAAIEIGMNHEGEIGRLTAIVSPDVGLVTCAAAVHVEVLGTVENVSRAKGELYTGLSLEGVAVANADDPLMSERARWAGRRTLWFGTSETAEYRLVRTVSHDARGLLVELREGSHTYDVRLPLVGLHNAMNAAAAFAAGRALGLDPEALVAGLSRARPPGRRLLLTPVPGADATLLDDCYNANPHSTVAALRTLVDLAPAGKRFAVLGDMRELGADEERGHREVGAAAAASGLELLVAFGPASRLLADEAETQGIPADRVVRTEDPAAAAEAVRARLVPGALVLVKASRGTRLERVSDLLAPPVGAAGVH